jgi:hypothetical protein
LRHTVEVEAESLYEAAALAVRTFRQHKCEPPLNSKLKVEISTAVIHTVTPRRIHEWSEGGERSPKERILKDRLRKLL